MADASPGFGLGVGVVASTRNTSESDGRTKGIQSQVFGLYWESSPHTTRDWGRHESHEESWNAPARNLADSYRVASSGQHRDSGDRHHYGCAGHRSGRSDSARPLDSEEVRQAAERPSLGESLASEVGKKWPGEIGQRLR